MKLLTNGTLTVVTSFSEKDGRLPQGLTEGVDGSFYGVTEDGGDYAVGTVFKVTPDGVLSTLAHFDRIAGADPIRQLAQGSDGNLYGLAYGGGRFNHGTFFRLIRTPEITIAPGASGNMLVIWTSFAQGAYRLEQKKRISDAGWLTVTEVTTGPGATTRTNVFSGVGEGYFRVVVLP